MNQLNSIIIEGTCIRDSQCSNILEGMKKAEVTIEVTRNVYGSNEVEKYYFDIEAYGNLADALSRSAVRGRGVRVVGRLKQSSWQDGEKIYKIISIVAEHIEFKPMKNIQNVQEEKKD